MDPKLKKRFIPPSILQQVIPTIHNCVAASVALRGRNPRLSALAYVINSTLTQGGVKPIFKRLSKMGITTTHSNVLNKQKEMKAAGYNINIKCWREDCELFFQHSGSGEVCLRPPPTAKPTEESASNPLILN